MKFQGCSRRFQGVPEAIQGCYRGVNFVPGFSNGWQERSKRFQGVSGVFGEVQWGTRAF